MIISYDYKTFIVQATDEVEDDLRCDCACCKNRDGIMEIVVNLFTTKLLTVIVWVRKKIHPDFQISTYLYNDRKIAVRSFAKIYSDVAINRNFYITLIINLLFP